MRSGFTPPTEEERLRSYLWGKRKKGDDFIPQPKVRLQRFPVKAMFLGAIAQPKLQMGFDGLILLERISKEKNNNTKDSTYPFHQ